MKWLAAALATILLALCLTPAYAIPPSPDQTRQVVCMYMPRAGFGRYRTRPQNCPFHEAHGISSRGTFTVLRVQRLHWRHWGQRVAVGVGALDGPGKTWVKIKVRLTIPWSTCGHAVYTHAKFTLEDGYQWGESIDDALKSVDCPSS